MDQPLSCLGCPHHTKLSTMGENDDAKGSGCGGEKAGSDEHVVEESTIGQVEIGVAKGSFDKIKIGEENCL